MQRVAFFVLRDCGLGVPSSLGAADEAWSSGRGQHAPDVEGLAGACSASSEACMRRRVTNTAASQASGTLGAWAGSSIR